MSHYMEPKFVYRALRQLSRWSLGFYSEIHVDGAENVPPDGPLIIVATHHNEILDIATLAVTIPYGRMLSFWAKASLFAHPFVRAIMRSSGSIPVHRNPNSMVASVGGTGANVGSRSERVVSGNGPGPQSSGDGHRLQVSGAKRAPPRQALFHATFRALDASGAVGVFPEGTSYTEPRIVQVKDGAARVVLEYMQWVNDRKGRYVCKNGLGGIRVVPVGIVYTDKARYQSRVCVRYGKPIDLTSFAEQDLSRETDEDRRVAIRALTNSIETRLCELTINAPDWNTLYIACTARDMLWEDSDAAPVQDFVAISQTLIDLFASSSPCPSLSHTKSTLLAYHALLVHAGISHTSLPSASLSMPRAIADFATRLMKLLLYLSISLPAVLPHLPAYAFGRVLECLFATPGAEETRAEFLAVGGVLGAGLGYAGMGIVFAKIWTHMMGSGRFGMWLVCVWAAKMVLGGWHRAVVRDIYEQLQQLRTSFIVLLSLFSSQIAAEDLAPYMTPPPPPSNLFIRRATVTADPAVDEIAREPPPPVSAHALIGRIFEARMAATDALRAFLLESARESDSDDRARAANVHSRCPILSEKMGEFTVRAGKNR